MRRQRVLVLLVVSSLIAVFVLKQQAERLFNFKISKHFHQIVSKNETVTSFATQTRHRTKMVIPRDQIYAEVDSSNDKSYPLILYWNHAFYDKRSSVNEHRRCDPCPMTMHRGKIAEAKAIVFHYSVIHESDLPWRDYRDPDQVFVWWSAEPPGVILSEGRNFSEFDGFFNWTWTYRSDSDVTRDYGNRAKALFRARRGTNVDEIIAAKKGLAIWFASNCNGTHGARLRWKYMMEVLETGLPVTLYGSCFGIKTLRHDPQEIRKHKFYFAFENGLHCKDYVTEKFWDNALANDVVPVVWGPTKNDILGVAPLDSFIFAEDFQTPQKLAEYLKYLDTNDREYRKYFRWREDESMTDKKMINMTRNRFPELNVQERPVGLCEKLMRKNPKKVVKSLVTDFFDNNPTECSG